MKEISAALAKAQPEFKTAAFDKVNPHFKSPYASLTSVMAAVKEALSKNGLAISQSIIESAVITKLIHSSGECIETSVPLLVSKNDMQGLGSAITYGRRYGISALLGIVTDDDDDGNASMPEPKAPIARHEPKPRPQNAVVQSYPQKSGVNCTLCGTETILSKSGAGYYCPNFKDTSRGEHFRFKVTELLEWQQRAAESAKSAEVSEDDIPF